jgi:hypothetical protein
MAPTPTATPTLTMTPTQTLTKTPTNPLFGSVNNVSPYGNTLVYGNGGYGCTTNPPTVLTASGGSGTYTTYNWTVISGGPIIINNPSGVFSGGNTTSTTFTHVNIFSGFPSGLPLFINASVQCVIKDSASNSYTVGPINVELEWDNGS